MRFFQEAFAGLAAYRSIEQAKANGISPVSLTGVAQIHKAQLLVTLCQSGTVLAVTGDEAEAKGADSCAVSFQGIACNGGRGCFC